MNGGSSVDRGGNVNCSSCGSTDHGDGCGAANDGVPDGCGSSHYGANSANTPSS